MTTMKDMESLIHEIKNKKIRDYMKESLSCYNISAYKASINLSFNSLMYDLVEKLKPLADINADAKDIYKDIAQLIKEQKNYEGDLINRMSSKNIISTNEKEQILMFQKLRHKCSHPSGFNPSAENARFVFHDIIINFLSKEKLLTTERIDEIIESLGDKFYFPLRKLSVIKSHVEEEIKELHPDSYTILIDRLVKDAIKNKEVSRWFLLGMAAIKRSEIDEILIKLISKKLSDDRLSPFFIQLFNVNNQLYKEVNEGAELRLLAILKNKTENIEKGLSLVKYINPLSCVFIIEKHWEGSKLYDGLINSSELLKAFSISDYFEGLFEKLKGGFREKFTTSYIEDGIGSNDFTTSNKYMKDFYYNELVYLPCLHDDECIRILCAIISSAKIGAINAEKAIAEKFSDYQDFYERVKKIIENGSGFEIIENYELSHEEIADALRN